jgi:UDP-N-acetylglucosamine--N-acetylmuramyl-(pentapeptide) pyrophosphoryl-undecaprenol N-acetylglucosamine transferase
MKIVITGGGSGGHFYPLIAVIEELHDIIDERKLAEPDIYYLSIDPYDSALLYQHAIEYRKVRAGKLRKYVSIKNGIDFLQTLIGVPQALALLFKIYPDVVFTKGGYPSVPVCVAARILGIPVFVHESDTVPGRANLFAAKFAVRVATSYPEAATRFNVDKKKIACVGNPVRKELRIPIPEQAHVYFNLRDDVPTVLVLGGSQGAEHINNTVFGALHDILPTHQVIHQIGKSNFTAYKQLVDVALRGKSYAANYRPVPYLSALEMVTAAGAAHIIVSRAGSNSIFEIAQWEKPSLIVPIPEHVSRDQKENAYAYARAGGCEVIEQKNFTPHVFVSEVVRLLGDAEAQTRMILGARNFKRPNAAREIAEEMVRIALGHEK